MPSLAPTLILVLAGLSARPYGNALGDGLGLADRPPAPSEGQVCAAGETLFGIDVSIYQGTIDWNAVAADGVVFAWVRVSHSTAVLDSQFAANLAGARAAGIHTGVYQYFEPGEDPIAQAQLLLDNLGPLQPGDMPPMIDVESANTVPQAQYVDAIRAWLDHVEAATGTVPFIYSGYYYWNDNVGSGEFADHPLWIANYNPGCPLVPDAWASWTVHQTCDCGTVAGIDGAVDTDLFNGNLDVLLGHAVGAAVCGDGKCIAETPYNCPQDCPPCGVIGPEGGTIDNDEACLELYGPLEYWRDVAVGHGGSLRWTAATEWAEPSNYAVWRMYFAESGTYRLSTWIEQPYGETQQLTYRVNHAGGESAVPGNQSLASGWLDLGEFSFNAGADHWVRINDNTGELESLEVAIACDALRIERIDVGETTGPGETDSGGGELSGEQPTAGWPGGTGLDSSGGGPDSGPDPVTNTDALPPGFEQEDGCGCTHSRGGGAGVMAALALLLSRRRRRGDASAES
ncbi:GH25 family lysozyme [Nannocystis sp. SCPEA4]|uniref:GH25 family lysozyme n=1 Tax=Nannocystis sp. SCPEA4 TaxID=2996787 RepID=UPI00226DC7EB|nr:GH25 family lysozyme [Nannocystis sp. SCPEA4]MCY1054714.1 GH25 family lysozyme [Nannocystis sp. SCPEA4]